jgi:type II secretory pathway pseudopilin PulG
MAGMVFTDRVADITYQKILPSIVDQINNSNVFLARILNKPGSWRGVYMAQPIETANSTTGGSFSGMDTFPTAATNNTRLMTWYLAAFEQSVVVPGIEKAVNARNEQQVLRLLATRLDEAKVSALQAVGQIAYGVGSGKDFDGLGLIVDAGTNSSSYAGITRTTSPYINADVTAVTSGIITLDYLSSEFDNVSAASSTSESPTIGLTTKTIWTYIEGLLQPMVSARYETLQLSGYDRVDGGTPNGQSVPASAKTSGFAGFNAISYRARPLVADDNCTSQTFFWLNENYLEFDRLQDSSLRQIQSNVEVTEGYYKNVTFPAAWQFRELIAPVNQYGEVGLLILMGNLIHRQPRRNGKLTGITSN